MPITIGSNIASLQAQRQLHRSSDGLSRVFERLATGQRINRASDDAAGLGIATSLNVGARIYSQSVRNINDGLSILAIADGAVSELKGIVTRIAELAEQSANGIYSDRQRQALNREAQALSAEYSRITQTTTFNDMPLLDGSTGAVSLQVGTESGQNSQLRLELSSAFVTTGVGTFQNGTNLVTSLGRIGPLDTADFNKDGVTDVLVQGSSGSGLFVLLGNGDGTFKARISIHPGFGQGRAAHTADLNNDGNVDIAFSNHGNINYVVLGNGNGTFNLPTTVSNVGAGVSWIEITDLNSDGNKDLIIAGGSTNAYFVHLGNGDGSFAAATTYALGESNPVVIARDLNGDGHLDILAQNASSTGSYFIALGNGNGTFNAHVSFTSTINSSASMNVGDVNGDGALDIIGLNIGLAPGLTLTLGNGDGTFRARATLDSAVTIGPGGILLADINNDSMLDILQTGIGNMFIYLGNGNGTFRAAATYTSGSTESSHLTRADITGDGVPDILMSTWNDGNLVLFSADTSIVGESLTLPSLNLSSQSSARTALTAMTETLSELTQFQGKLGAVESRLKIALSLNTITAENYQAAGARIIDADMAQSTAELVRLSILKQSAAAVLAQANQGPSLALTLLNS